ATASDVDAAVGVVEAAFEGWASTPVDERVKYLTRIGDALGARVDELATDISKEAGMVTWLSQLVPVGLPINSFNAVAARVASYTFEETAAPLIVREPIGVIGCITPWNYPLRQIAVKIADAMVAGHRRRRAERDRPDRCVHPRRVIHEVGRPAFRIAPASARWSVRPLPPTLTLTCVVHRLDARPGGAPAQLGAAGLCGRGGGDRRRHSGGREGR
ncbi:MAG: aldehyde dehydrogenase family protein, partial [Ilumatobacteraceae bacterium]